MDHSVVFTGAVRDDFSRSQVRENFSRIFKVTDEARLNRVFSGKAMVLKKGLSAAEAEKYHQILTRAGAVCEIHPPKPVQDVLVVPAAPAGLAVAGATEDEDKALAKRLNLGELVEDFDAEPAPRQEAPVHQSAAVPAGGLDLPPLESPATPSAPRPPAPPRFAVPAGLALAPVEERNPEPAAVAAPEPAFAGAAGARMSTGGSAVAEPPGQSFSLKEGSGWGKYSDIPDEVRGLCWGGFFAPLLWGTFNGMALSFAPVLAIKVLRRVLPAWVWMIFLLVFGAVYLVKGRELAWKYKKWDSVEHFNRVQRYWSIGGFFIFAIVMSWLTAIVVVQRHEASLEKALAIMREAEVAAAKESDPVAREAILARARESYLDSISDPRQREQVRQDLEAQESIRAAEGGSPSDDAGQEAPAAPEDSEGSTAASP